MKLKIPILLLAAVLLIATGWTDLDWMVVSYRYSDWHRAQADWEFCPFLKVNWWLAFEFSLFRFALGWLLLGMIIMFLLFRFFCSVSYGDSHFCT